MTAAITFQPILPPGPPLTVMIGDGDVKPTVDGGWQTTGRPRRVALTEWVGWNPATLDIPLLFDGFRTDESVEQQIGVMEGYMRNTQGGAQPPVLTITGPVPYTDRQWVVQGVDWGSAERRSSDGQRTRQDAVVHLLEYVAVDLLVSIAPSPAVAAVERATGAPPAAAGPPAAGSTYTVASGDTLAGIAQKLLGKASRWPEIGTLNGIRDPRTLKVGQVLRIPS